MNAAARLGELTPPFERTFRPRAERLVSIGTVLLALLVLHYCLSHSYLLFHGIVEVLTVAIAFTLFILAWTSRGYLKGGYLEFVGIGYGAIGVIDLVHTLAYKGMNVFPDYDAGLSVQLWIAARYLQALTLLVATTYQKKKPNRAVVIPALVLAGSALLWVVFSGRFPVCYVDGVGVTPFKIYSEYVIVGMLLVALWSTWRQEPGLPPQVRPLVLLSIGFTAAAELSFSNYMSLYGPANVIGHDLKLVAFLLICRALIVTGIREPFALIFRDLGQANRNLRAANEEQQAMNREFQQLNAELQSREKLLRQANLLIEEASRAKSDFLANMSHELRTPLNSIIGFADILDQGLQGALTAEQAESVRDIGKSGRHLLSLINDILDLSRIEAGKMELLPAEVDLEQLVPEVLALFKQRTLEHRLSLTAEIGEGSGQFVADARKVKQVIINLLSNAVKFTPDDGRIRLRTRRVAAAGALAAQTGGPAAEFLEFAVEDTGIGISPEDQRKLFRPFQQVHTILTKEHGGTGLGLSLCKHFVELHGGTIRVESEPGRGSTFTFTLPFQPPGGEGGSAPPPGGAP